MTELQPDDMKTNLFVTVLDIKEKKIERLEQDTPFLNLISSTLSGNYNHVSYNPNTTTLRLLKGIVLRIEAINLPYLIVTAFDKTPTEINKVTISLDVRTVIFTKLSKEYIFAYLGKEMESEIINGEKN